MNFQHFRERGSALFFVLRGGHFSGEHEHCGGRVQRIVFILGDSSKNPSGHHVCSRIYSRPSCDPLVVSRAKRTKRKLIRKKDSFWTHCSFCLFAMGIYPSTVWEVCGCQLLTNLRAAAQLGHSLASSQYIAVQSRFQRLRP